MLVKLYPPCFVKSYTMTTTQCYMKTISLSGVCVLIFVLSLHSFKVLSHIISPQPLVSMQSLVSEECWIQNVFLALLSTYNNCCVTFEDCHRFLYPKMLQSVFLYPHSFTKHYNHFSPNMVESVLLSYFELEIFESKTKF